MVGERRWQRFCEKRDAIDREQKRLGALRVLPDNALGRALRDVHDVTLSKDASALDLLRRPELDYAGLMRVPGLGPGHADGAVAAQVEVQAKYAGYLGRQAEEIERSRRNESKVIPDGFDYGRVKGLSAEVREKFERVRPETIGQASRIPGVTPAAVSLLLVFLKKGEGGRQVA